MKFDSTWKCFLCYLPGFLTISVVAIMCDLPIWAILVLSAAMVANIGVAIWITWTGLKSDQTKNPPNFPS